MKPEAWVMLALTWSVILFFAGRFFWKVLQTPPRPDDDEDSSPVVLRKDA